MLSTIFSGERLFGSLLEMTVPYHCYTEGKCGYTPPGDFSTNCYKEKFCEHRNIFVNKSTAKWFYAFVDESSQSPAGGVLPSLSFVQYPWHRSVGKTYKHRSEWDPNFNRDEDPMPEDPEIPISGNLYIVFALDAKKLEKAVSLVKENKEKAATQYANVVKLVFATDAKKEDSISSIVLLKPQLGKNGIKVLSGRDAAKIIENEKLSEIVPNKV